MPSARMWAPLLIALMLLLAPWAMDPVLGAEALPPSAGTPSASVPAATPVVDAADASAIQALLADSCLSCHGEAKQRGRLRLDSRAAMLIGGKSGPAVIPGDAEHSLLMRAVRYDDPELQMPPDKPLSTQQLATLARWIVAGAPWSGDASVVPSRATTSASAAALAAHAPGTIQRGTPTAAPTTPTHHPAARRPPLIGRVHPIVVHFPIACLLLAVLAEFLVVTGGPRWDPLVRFLMVCGSLGAVVAVVTGTWFAPEGTLFHHEDHLLTRHEFVGWVTMILALVSSAVLIGARAPRARLIFRLLLLMTSGVAGLTGHLGGAMVYGEHFLF